MAAPNGLKERDLSTPARRMLSSAVSRDRFAAEERMPDERIIIHLEPEHQMLTLRCRKERERTEMSFRIPNLRYAVENVFKWLRSLGELQIRVHQGPGDEEARRHLLGLGLAFQAS
jgi:hypothetical protein